MNTFPLMRERTPAPGMNVWVRADMRYLKRGQVGIVYGVREGGMVLDVSFNRGSSSRLVYTHHIDAGWEFQTKKGKWISENSPLARKWACKAVEDILQGGTAVVPAEPLEDRRRVLETLLQVLWRHGWRP